MTMTIEAPRHLAQPGPAAPTPKDRTMWVGAVGLLLAAALLGAGGFLRNDADFAKDYVARQLGEQRITFKAADTLNDEERQTPCLVAYAGMALTTGAQAECYANNFIGRHLKSVAGGKTFSEMRVVQNDLRADIAKAQGAGDPAAADLQRQLAEVTGKHQTLFEGETVRGLLLTSFGFSELGAKADLGANVAYAAGGALALLSLAVIVRSAVRRPRAS